MSRCGDLPMAAQTAICDWYNGIQQGARLVPAAAFKPDGTSIPTDQIQMPAQVPVSPGDLADATITMNRTSSDASGMPRFELLFNRPSGMGLSALKTEWPVKSVTEDDLRSATDQPVAQKVQSDTELLDDPKITIDKLRWLPYRKGLLLGDLLEGIAMQSGRDVIADYYLQGKTLDAVKAQTLKKTAEMICKQFEYTCQVDAKTVRFRDNKWYTRNMYADPPAQVPDALWSKIEQNGAVAIRDLLPIASLATDQMKWPGWGFIPGADVACESPCTVRLWASLTDLQEKTARKGGLPVSQLTEDQRVKLDDMIAERKLLVNHEDLGTAVVSMSTIKPQVTTMDGGMRVVSMKNIVTTSGDPGGVPNVTPGQPSNQQTTAPTVTWSGSPGSTIGGFGSSTRIGDPATWLARMGNSVNETLLLVLSGGKPMIPVTLSMPQPISEAERKEVIAQRKADRDAESVDVIR
jgi:hypothetical protein